MGYDKFRRKVIGKYQGNFYETQNVLVGALTATTGAGTPYSVVNPLGTALLVTKVVVYTTGAISATPVTLKVGIGSSAGGAYDNLIDDVVVGTPTGAGVFDNSDDKGTNGQNTYIWGASEYLNVTVTGTPTGLVGKVYIYYVKPA